MSQGACLHIYFVYLFGPDAVKEFLGQLSCHRSIAEHGSYALEGTYEFDMLYQSKPLHVVLGEDQFCYSGTGMFKEFNISNGSAAIDRSTSLPTPERKYFPFALFPLLFLL